MTDDISNEVITFEIIRELSLKGTLNMKERQLVRKYIKLKKIKNPDSEEVAFAKSLLRR